MQVEKTALEGVLKITLSVHEDPRGRFIRVFDAPVYAEEGIPTSFAQDNVSVSSEGVLRGLHYQRAHPQGKLVGVHAGAILDVVVDLRQASPQFGQWVGITLDSEAPEQLWVPPGFAHGFCVLRAPAVVHYRCTTPYDPEDQCGVRWNDPELGIDWPVSSPVLSERDGALPLLHEVPTALLF